MPYATNTVPNTMSGCAANVNQRMRNPGLNQRDKKNAVSLERMMFNSVGSGKVLVVFSLRCGS
jgi:hypothetical protein